MRTVLTFDYEIFFGTPAGTAQRCVIEPTLALSRVAMKHGAKLVFFVDAGWILRMRIEMAKSSVLRGAQIGDGAVVAAHAVVRGEVPAYSVVAGVPGRVVRDRRAAYDLAAAERAALDDMSRKARAVTAVGRTR